MSLILVQQQLPTRGRWLEIAALPDGGTSMVKQREDGSVLVKPWPFQKPLFVAEIDVTVLDQLTFATSATLVASLKRAPIVIRRWEFSRRPPTRSAKTSPAAACE